MGYLFVYFTGEQQDGEQVYFSVSHDGLRWEDLNQGKPVLRSGIGEKGVRDPFVIRHPKTNRYYLIATDLCIQAGRSWESAQTEGSLDIIVWESVDLQHWSQERSCRIGAAGAGCVWAPEAVYDEKREAFFLFFTSRIFLPGDVSAKHRIFGSYTTDFHTFSEPFLYIDRETDVIDATIIQAQGRFYRFFKDETNKTILLDKGDDLLGEFTPVRSDILRKLKGVEGPECFLLPDGKTWCLMVDRFQEGKGYLPLLTDDPGGGSFRFVEEKSYDLGRSKKRHGGILKISDEEYENLKKIACVRADDFVS